MAKVVLRWYLIAVPDGKVPLWVRGMSLKAALARVQEHEPACWYLGHAVPDAIGWLPACDPTAGGATAVTAYDAAKEDPNDG